MSEDPPVEFDPEMVAVVDLAVRLGYGRGGRRGCAIPFAQLQSLREKLSDEELDALVKSVRQADFEAEQREAAARAKDKAARRPLPLLRRWLASLRR